MMLLSHAFAGCPTRVGRPLQRPLSSARGNNAGALVVPANFYCNNNNNNKAKIGAGKSRKIKAALVTAAEPYTTTVHTRVTVKKVTGEDTSVQVMSNQLQGCQKSLKLKFASVHLDPRTGKEKEPISAEAKLVKQDKTEEIYETNFSVPENFGEIGAVIVENHNDKEMYVKKIELSGLASDPLNITCNSWVQPHSLVPTQKRVFFTNKSYLPSETPDGLRSMRETELVNLRGNGTGERQSHDRVYDYDVYNDLGDPDASEDLKRPILGGRERPYPRRGRTGRPPSKTDPQSESRTKANNIYVPRDETFSNLKENAFNNSTILAALNKFIPDLKVYFDHKAGFPDFKAIDALFSGDSFNVLPPKSFWPQDLIPWIIKYYKHGALSFQFPSPEPLIRNKLFWLSDKEFARETLAGINPCSIQLVKEWPLRSQLDPEVYGCAESAFNTQMIDKEIGSMTVQEAIQKKKLFMLDYNDMLLPYVKRVRALEGTTLYGSRTLFFLDEDETLRPLAIELTRPPMDGKGEWKEVYGPSADATSLWLWRFAKCHVLAHDAGYHQLVTHWLRTHCAMEPYVIATNRQLSAMHPIYRLLHPHLRYTMEINANARYNLVNAGGTIENTFSPLKYSMEFSSTAYDLQWQFDLQGLPADLIHRGLAEKNPLATHGLTLHIKDYPFANDGLILWDALKQWVTDYVEHYYPKPYLVASDTELQAWWTEIRTVGHGDKQDEPWWPLLNTSQDLIDVVTNIAWVASAHHASVNFGQYSYAGYFPNRPSITRTNMPTEDYNLTLWKSFLNNPLEMLLKAFPSKYQATQVMLVMDVLSSHHPDEEYLGNNMEPSWADNPVIKEAFHRFTTKMKELEMVIDHRNADCNLKNRTGAGVTPYELMKPFSGPGVTGKGVPYSVSI